jgi:hypothetical protein
MVDTNSRLFADSRSFVLEALFKTERQRILLDMKEVNLVSLDVVRFLIRHEGAGLRLKDCPPYIREWIAGVRGER